MRNVLLKLRPWSPSAFVVALLLIALAASIQEMLAIFGTKLYFASFFPAILLASLVAGAPAGIFATALSIPIVWWAFLPPTIVLTLISFALLYLQSSLDEVFNPRLRRGKKKHLAQAAARRAEAAKQLAEQNQRAEVTA